MIGGDYLDISQIQRKLPIVGEILILEGYPYRFRTLYKTNVYVPNGTKLGCLGIRFEVVVEDNQLKFKSSKENLLEKILELNFFPKIFKVIEIGERNLS